MIHWKSIVKEGNNIILLWMICSKNWRCIFLFLDRVTGNTPGISFLHNSNANAKKKTQTSKLKIKIKIKRVREHFFFAKKKFLFVNINGSPLPLIIFPAQKRTSLYSFHDHLVALVRSLNSQSLSLSSLFSLSHTHTHTNWNAALRSISITIKTEHNRNSFQHSTRRRTRKKLCFFQKWECWESRGVSARGSPKLREWKPPFSPARVWRWPESPLPQVRFPVPVSWSTGIFFWPLMWIFRLLLLRRLPRSASKTASLQLSFLTGFQFFPFFNLFLFFF